MPETNHIIQDGVDRFREALGSLESEAQRVQRDLRARRKKLARRFAAGRKDLEKRFEAGRRDLEKRTKRLRSELQKSPALKRLDKARKDAAKQLEQGVSDVLATFQIASRSDLQRIDRKISQLSKKVREMDGAKRPSGRATSTA